jgi:hypothetical protein
MSHFSFTRTSSDKCALEQSYKESTSPFDWRTDQNVVESKSSCFVPQSPYMYNPKPSIPAMSVDKESDLRGQTRILSKCNIDKYAPPIKQQENELNICDDNILLIPKYTRVRKPCNIFAGITINRFNPLCEDPQELHRIHSNAYIGVNTRLQVKDKFAKKK